MAAHQRSKKMPECSANSDRQYEMLNSSCVHTCGRRGSSRDDTERVEAQDAVVYIGGVPIAQSDLTLLLDHLRAGGGVEIGVVFSEGKMEIMEELHDIVPASVITRLDHLRTDPVDHWIADGTARVVWSIAPAEDRPEMRRRAVGAGRLSAAEADALVIRAAPLRLDRPIGGPYELAVVTLNDPST